MKREFEIINDQKNTRVLDVGCGDGTLMKFLSKEKNIDVTKYLKIVQLNGTVNSRAYLLLKVMLKQS